MLMKIYSKTVTVHQQDTKITCNSTIRHFTNTNFLLVSDFYGGKIVLVGHIFS